MERNTCVSMVMAIIDVQKEIITIVIASKGGKFASKETEY